MQVYHAIGIMSGTSLDGLDVVLCKFENSNQWKFEIIKSETIEYSLEWKQKLANAQSLSGINLQLLHKEFGSFIGNTVNIFLHNIPFKVDFISSHGHTVFHQPEKGITLQIGDGNQIASITNIKTINDFRSLDVALGGQGAPLVPIGDEFLFSEYDYCLNIGGFTNISFKENNKRLAYDICPANIITNFLANKLGHVFDKDGNIGKNGNINSSLLNNLNSLEYYKINYPKSLGREWLEELFIPILATSNCSIPDQIATIYEHIAIQISNAIKPNDKTKVLVTGGGAYNKYLIEKIKQKTNAQIVIPDNEIIEYKEALIFAFLGSLRLTKQINCLASVTGAKKDSSGGIIHLV